MHTKEAFMAPFIIISSVPNILLAYMLIKIAIETPKNRRAEEAGKASHKLWGFVWDEIVNGTYRRFGKAEWQEILVVAQATDAEYTAAWPFIKSPRGVTELVEHVFALLEKPVAKKPKTCHRFVHGRRRFR